MLKSSFCPFCHHSYQPKKDLYRPLALTSCQLIDWGLLQSNQLAFNHHWGDCICTGDSGCINLTFCLWTNVWDILSVARQDCPMLCRICRSKWQRLKLSFPNDFHLSKPIHSKFGLIEINNNVDGNKRPCPFVGEYFHVNTTCHLWRTCHIGWESGCLRVAHTTINLHLPWI